MSVLLIHRTVKMVHEFGSRVIAPEFARQEIRQGHIQKMPVMGLKLLARRSSGESSTQQSATAGPRFCSKVEGKIFSLDLAAVNDLCAIGAGAATNVRLIRYLSGAAREIRTPDPSVTNFRA
jgi:hypothetical protein